MTTTNTNPGQQAVSNFLSLGIDERLTVLASLFSQISNSISAEAIDSLPTQKAGDLVAQIQQLSPEEQQWALRDILPAQRTDQDEVILDPNPSKAMVELAQGGTTVPVGEYGKMNAEAKLAFWYLLAQRLGSNIISIPTGSQPSQQATTLLNSLKSMDTDQLVSFLTQVL